MTITEYDAIADSLLAEARAIETAKRPGYTIGSDDVLANFTRVADRVGITPGQALAVYLLKHVDAVTAALVDPTIPQAESLLGRFADLINYTRLGYALIWEQQQGEERCRHSSSL